MRIHLHDRVPMVGLWWLWRAHVCLIYLRLVSRWSRGRYSASACDRGRKLRGKWRVTHAPRNFPAISLQFPAAFRAAAVTAHGRSDDPTAPRRGCHDRSRA